MVETSVILLNYNGLHHLKRCIPSVLRQSYKNFELIIVDNASTDGSVAWLRKQYASHKKIRVVVLKENQFFAGGNNHGVKFARGKYVVLLNNDTIAPATWLGALVRGARRNPGAVVSSLVVDKGYEGIAEQIMKESRFATLNLVTEWVTTPVRREEISSGEVETFSVGGNAICYERRKWKRPFDDDYVIYAEDVYFCWRARLQGAHVKVILDSRIKHVGGASRNLTPRINKIAVFNGMKNQLLNMFLFYNWWTLVRIWPILVLSQVGHVLYDRRKFVPKLKVWFWICTHPLFILRKRRAIQRERKISDRETVREMSWVFFNDPFRKLPRHLSVLLRVTNACVRAYARLVGLRTKEYYLNR